MELSSERDRAVLVRGRVYAIVKAASQALGLRAMAKDLGVDLKIKIITVVAAAKGVSLRRGIGQVRHIQVNQSWIQDRVRRWDIDIEKVGVRAFGCTARVLSPRWETRTSGSNQ